MKKILIKGLLALVLTSLALVLITDSVLHRWVIPNINDWRPRIESYLSDKIGHPIKIGSIKAKSTGLIPSFDIEQVQVLDTAHKPALQLGRVQVDISALSLLTFQIDRLLIDSPLLEISRDGAGKFTIAGFQIDPQATSNKASDWVFSQKEIVISNGTINWIDAKPHLFGNTDALPKATFSGVAITLKNGMRSHNISLQATPPLAFGQSIEVIGKFTQPLHGASMGQWQAWTGSATASVKNIPQLAKQLNARIDWPLQNASLDGEQIALARLPHILQSLGQKLPSEFPSEILQSTQLPHLKLTAKGANSAKLQVRIDTAIVNPDITGELGGTWTQARNELDLSAQFKRMNLAELYRYVPVSTANSLRQKMQHSIQKGIVQDVRIAYVGGTKDFLNGTKLRATGRVDNGQFSIPTTIAADPPPWTHWSNTQFTFNLDGTQLEVRSIDAELAGLATKGSVTIADIQKPVIEANARVSGVAGNILQILKVEPLKAATDNLFVDSEATGPITAALQLTLPLATPEKNKITGHITLANNDFSIDKKMPSLSRMQGKIHFSESEFRLDNLHGKLLGGDVKFSGNGQKIEGNGIIGIDALAALPALSTSASILSRVKGSTPYSFLFRPEHGAGLVIESSLAGIQLDLPHPFAKPADSIWPLRFSQTQLAPHQERVTFRLANLVNAEFIHALAQTRGDDTKKVLRGGIAIGLNQVLQVPEKGVNAQVRLDQVDIEVWRPFLPAFNVDKIDLAANVSSYLPTTLTAEIGTLRAAERHFDNIVMTASQSGSAWRVNAKSNDFSGYVEYRTPANEQAGQVYARLSRFTVPDASSSTKIEKFLQDAPPTALPALDLVIEDFELVGKKLGRLEVSAVNQRAKGYLGPGTAQEWRVQKLNITNPDAELKATGVWTPAESSNARRVDFQFDFKVADTGALLTRFGQAGTLKDGSGGLQGRVAWVGSPLALHYPTLTGQVKLDIAKGQFLKINPGNAGRFMNVLSLQALPKLLTLDFRDIFSDGFVFDSITGDAQIVEGVLSSNNLQMKSSLALVSVDGKVDLGNETQNLHVLVLPDLNAGGVSLIATLINPVIGAAAYLTQLILRRPVIAAATREFSIDGSWREPNVVQVKK
jgi:uncharacterized protein (TIGR02099 family)